MAWHLNVPRLMTIGSTLCTMAVRRCLHSCLWTPVLGLQTLPLPSMVMESKRILFFTSEAETVVREKCYLVLISPPQPTTAMVFAVSPTSCVQRLEFQITHLADTHSPSLHVPPDTVAHVLHTTKTPNLESSLPPSQSHILTVLAHVLGEEALQDLVQILLFVLSCHIQYAFAYITCLCMENHNSPSEQFVAHKQVVPRSCVTQRQKQPQNRSLLWIALHSFLVSQHQATLDL